MHFKNFFEKINLSNIAHFFETFTVKDIYDLEEDDLKEIIDDKKYIKERIKLRKFLFSTSVEPAVVLLSSIYESPFAT